MRTVGGASGRRLGARDGGRLIHEAEQRWTGTEVVPFAVDLTPHDLRTIEVFTENEWLCSAYPQGQLSRERSEAVILERRAAAREMGRRKAAASRKARTRIAPMTGTSAVEETAVITSRTATPESQSPSDQQTGELLHILGFADQLNTAVPAQRDGRRA